MNIVKNKKKLSQCIQSIKTHNHTPFILNTDYKTDSLYKILSKNPSLINKKDNKNETLLSYSIKRNNIDNFNLILTSPNLDLNYQNKEGNSYLHIAILFEREEMIKTLIKKGININMKNNEGNTPLHIAYKVGNKNIINELIRNNIDLRIKNKYGLIGYENKKKKIKKSNCEINSFNKCKSNYKINIFENKNKSNCEILKPHIKEINNDKNKKINLKMFKIQKSILYKKKGDNLTEETKSNSPPNSNNSIRSNNYKIYDYNHNYENIFSLTSSHEIKKKMSKNDNELNIISNDNFSNSNSNYNNYNNKTNINNNNNKTNSLNKLDNIMISGTNQINYKDNPIKHKSSYIPIAQPKQEYTLSDNPEIEQKIKDLFLNKIHSSDFNKMKCFKKWKLNIIKPKIFLGKKDRKIRLRTRIYRDEPAKSSSIVSRRKAKDEIIVSNPIKRNPNIKHNEYQNYIIKNSPNVGQKEKKIKTLNELYNESIKEDEKKEAIKNRKIDSVKKIKDIFNK